MLVAATGYPKPFGKARCGEFAQQQEMGRANTAPRRALIFSFFVYSMDLFDIAAVVGVQIQHRKPNEA